MLPIRCFTCGKVIGNKWDKYSQYCQDSNQEDALDKLGMTRYCCRRMFLTHVDVTEKVLDYNAVHVNTNPYIHVKTQTVDKSKRTYSTN